MSFVHVQDATPTHVIGAGTSLSLTFGAAPTPGNLIIVATATADNITTGLTVKDGNNNAFAFTTNSFRWNAGDVLGAGIFYILAGPANISSTVNMTWTTASVNGLSLHASEFSYTGTAFFDQDAVVAPGAVSNPNVVVPSLTPTNSNSLLYSVCAIEHQIVSPAKGATQGGWTGTGIDTGTSNAAEYMLSATGATAVAYTSNINSAFNAMSAAFFTVASSPSSIGWVNHHRAFINKR